LIILDPKNPIVLVDALLSGFIVNPVWYVWLGIVLWGASSMRKLPQNVISAKE
jgi:hypothetical protein